MMMLVLWETERPHATACSPSAAAACCCLLLEEANMEDQLRESVVAHLMKSSQVARSEGWDNVIGFFHAINWGERWIQGLIVIQLAFFFCVVVCRRREELQIHIAVLLFGLLYSTRWLNQKAAFNWKSFSTQNYFDKNCIFACIIFAGPLVLTAVTHLVCCLLYSFSQIKALAELNRNKTGIRIQQVTAEEQSIYESSGKSKERTRKKKRQ
jgi:hypothetical protein